MIELQNIKKSYGKKQILKGVDLTINDGEFIVFIGPSGCGKTTLLKMINKLIQPSSGTILIDGKNIADTDTISLRRSIGYVIQNIGLFPHMSIYENITLVPSLMHEKREDEAVYQRALELIEMMGLDESYLEKYPDQLSGGQQQRIGFARALANDPNIILMDEPFSALDPITRSQLQDQVVELQKKVKKTILFVTHDMDEALKIADRICIFQDGEVAQFDTPEAILKRPASDYVRSFVGEDKLWQNPNFIHAADVMIAKAATIHPSETLFRAIEKMRRNRVDSLIVVDENRRYLGILFMEELLQKSKRQLSIIDLMQKDIRTSYPDEGVSDILEYMITEKVRCIPVVDEQQQVVGALTRATLFAKIGLQYVDNADEDEEEIATSGGEF
ncbi:ABC transporter ATP-binding protein [Culicoidibacter larvae]|uniref:Quaternary amine transport ATP-binding protein n=1 Tax=Culicoidibacter larvae TaxID=2579976 RepID=A0A5R8QAG6_9FIRM|nr:ABC transporter ATP-binding protein [Culicoidibacter larvae]TLG72914.1 betaine/proline/choline family ABC transporter ATP-binding protein [Culicoidibacter larvae]